MIPAHHAYGALDNSQHALNYIVESYGSTALAIATLLAGVCHCSGCFAAVVWACVIHRLVIV
eukprot:SAG31_NODE_7084_length_1793_cov_2.528335_2_plen_62_part_00